jgi:hypothetical protein
VIEACVVTSHIATFLAVQSHCTARKMPRPNPTRTNDPCAAKTIELASCCYHARQPERPLSRLVIRETDLLEIIVVRWAFLCVKSASRWSFWSGPNAIRGWMVGAPSFLENMLRTKSRKCAVSGGYPRSIEVSVVTNPSPGQGQERCQTVMHGN